MIYMLFPLLQGGKCDLQSHERCVDFYMLIVSFKTKLLSFHLSVCTCFSFSSLSFLALTPGAVQEIREEHNGYPSDAEADQVASCTCSSVCSSRPCILKPFHPPLDEKQSLPMLF